MWVISVEETLPYFCLGLPPLWHTRASALPGLVIRTDKRETGLVEQSVAPPGMEQDPRGVEIGSAWKVWGRSGAESSHWVSTGQCWGLGEGGARVE